MWSDQFVGLNKRAIEYLEKYAIKATYIIIFEGEIVSTEEKAHVKIIGLKCIMMIFA